MVASAIGAAPFPGLPGLFGSESEDPTDIVLFSASADVCYWACINLLPWPLKLLCEDFCEWMTDNSTSDNCYEDCLQLWPVGVNYLICADLCDGLESQWIENEIVPEEDEPEEPAPIEIDADDCARITVTVDPWETLAAEFGGGWDLGYDDCTDDLLVDENAPNPFEFHGPFYDAANSLFEYCYLNAPAELTDLWPDSEWRFDDPSCYWLYLNVGLDINHADACWYLESAAGGEPGIPMAAQRAWDPTFIVSAQMPYVVYEIISSNRVPDVDSELVGVRIRYWAGVINHFSLFVPPETEQRIYEIDDLPTELFDGDGVTERGTLTKWWMSFIHSLWITVGWDDPKYGEVNTGIYYHCDPSRNVDAGPGQTYDGVTYQADSDGSPSPLCFSSHAAYEAGDAEMTSFLGHGVWGEVCMLVPPSELGDLDKLAKDGFDELFGPRVKIEFVVYFWGRDGRSIDGEPHGVERNFCLTRHDLEARSDLYRRVDLLRGTPYGRWVFREFDIERMRASGNAAPTSDCECEPEATATSAGATAKSGATRIVNPPTAAGGVGSLADGAKKVIRKVSPQ